MDMNLKLTQCIHFMDVIGMGIHAERILQKDKKRDVKIRVRLIGSSKMYNLVTKHNLVSTWGCEEPILEKV